MAPNYQNAKTYCIRNDASNDDIVYVGSTVRPLSERMGDHRKAIKQRPHYKLYQLMARVGVEHFHIELLHNFPCENVEQLNAEEGRLIRLHNTVENGVNERVAGRGRKVYYEETKEAFLEKQKQYVRDNQEAVNARRKAYRETHKEAVSDGKKDWYTRNAEAVKARVKARADANREQILAEQKKYREDHKEELKAKQKAHYEANKERVLQQHKEYKARKAAAKAAAAAATS